MKLKWNVHLEDWFSFYYYNEGVHIKRRRDELRKDEGEHDKKLVFNGTVLFIQTERFL